MTILMVLAVICLFLAAIGVGVKQVSLGWLGLFFWALTILIPLVI